MKQISKEDSNRLKESRRQSIEYKKKFGKSFEDIQKELGLAYPICFEEPIENRYK